MTKTFTASKVTLSPTLFMHIQEGVLYIRRKWTFSDESDVPLPFGGQVDSSINWASIPQDVRDALMKINSFTQSQAEQQALEKYGFTATT